MKRIIIAVERIVIVIEFKCAAHFSVRNNVIMFLFWSNDSKPHVRTCCIYCKSTNFGVLLYLANLANCVFSLIFVAANIYVDRTLHRRAVGRHQM